MARIIAVDNDIEQRHVYATMLEKLGYDAVMCKDGKEFMEALNSAPADLLIIDMDLPDISGIELCREIKKSYVGIGIPVIMVSSEITEDSIVDGFNAGAADYMTKPVNTAVLVAKLRVFLKISSLHRSELEMVSDHVLFLDRYRIEKILGYGVHSVVFLAYDSKEDREVAVKLLNKSITDNNLIDIFSRRIADFYKLDNQHIVKIYDYGQMESQIYLILECCGDGCLRRMMSCSRMNEHEAAKLALDIVEGMIALDEHDTCHLDIKPENIMFQNGIYKLTDFGMTAPRSTATMPLQAEIWSTIAYSSPESFEDVDQLDIRSDVYSLGVTLFEAVTGDNPFISDKTPVAMFRQFNYSPPELATLVKGISYEFSGMVQMMLSKNKEARPTLYELKKCFEYIYGSVLSLGECKLTYPKQNTIPEPEETKQILEETQKLKFDELRSIRDTREEKLSLLDNIGNVGYKLMQSDFKSKFKLSMPWTRAALTMVIFAIVFNLAGYYSYMFFSDTPEKKSQIPKISAMCLKCGAQTSIVTQDIRKEKCPNCGGPLGYATTCELCKGIFARPPEFNISRKAKMKEFKQKVIGTARCPYCKSFQVKTAAGARRSKK